jgi:hypothetical protein
MHANIKLIKLKSQKVTNRVFCEQSLLQSVVFSMKPKNKQVVEFWLFWFSRPMTDGHASESDKQSVLWRNLAAERGFFNATEGETGSRVLVFGFSRPMTNGHASESDKQSVLWRKP